MPAKTVALAVLCGWLSAAPAPAQTLEDLGRKYRESPSEATRAPLLRFASAHDGDSEGSLARFTLGVAAFEQNDFAAAAENLEQARRGLPRLADYVAFFLVSARLGAKDLKGIEQDLQGLHSQSGGFPLAGKALLLEADVKSALERPAEAIALLESRYVELPQPGGDLALALNYLAARQLPKAVSFFQRVYYLYPATEAAAQASDQLQALRQEMGADYPAAPPAMRLERAERWIAAREYRHARSELRELTADLHGTEGEIARVRLAGVDVLDGMASRGGRDLAALSVSSPEAAAERLYYLVLSARKLEDTSGILDAIERLERYGQSPWRLKALIVAGNYFLLSNDAQRFEPLYRSAYESFPNGVEASYSHWKVAWSAYLRRRGEAAELMREHLRMFPESTKAGAALYFLARLAEDSRDYPQAAALYREITARYPNYYYGLLARDRLARRELAAAATASTGLDFLAGLPAGNRSPANAAQTTPATQRRIARARLLRSAGFADWAEQELRFGARTDGQPHLLALEQARNLPEPHNALRTAKVMAPDYLSLSLSAAPLRFWELLFPMPWRRTLVSQAKTRSIDPFVVAGLIRQESEFNPKAISPAKAYGLTQVLPSTGRALARNAGMRRFRTTMLLEPETNLRLGISYLSTLVGQWSGKWEEALASYNAGKSRVEEWLTWADYREPAEFIETIPFTETREYVQAVLRNAAFYRRLYGEKGPLEASYTAPPPVKTLAPKPAPQSARAAASKSAAAKARAATAQPAARKRPASAARRTKRPHPRGDS